MGFLRLTCVAALMLSAGTTGAVAADAPGRAAVLTKPVNWVSQASATQMAAVYPKGAKGVGFANLGCLVATGGMLSQCRVVGEAPQGFGFGAAALSLAPDFRAHYVAGEEGASVLLPLEFDPAGPKPPVDPINCLAPLCVLEIGAGAPTPAQP